MDIFATTMPVILAKEGLGRLVDHPADRGGPTIWGITEARARSAGYTGPMASMMLDQALAIYRRYYWAEPHFDQIADIFPDLGKLLLDLGINNGPITAGKFLQRSLNVLNIGPGPDLVVDGVCGSMSRASLVAFRSLRSTQGGDALLLNLIRALAAVRYVEIAENDKSQRVFEFGWLANRAFGSSG
jgi:lysozyme family protein